jgi:hypothetical protein
MVGLGDLIKALLSTLKMEIRPIEYLLRKYVVYCEDGVVSGLLSKPRYENYSAGRGRKCYEVHSA